MSVREQEQRKREREREKEVMKAFAHLHIACVSYVMLWIVWAYEIASTEPQCHHLLTLGIGDEDRVDVILVPMIIKVRVCLAAHLTAWSGERKGERKEMSGSGKRSKSEIEEEENRLQRNTLTKRRLCLSCFEWTSKAPFLLLEKRSLTWERERRRLGDREGLLKRT